MTPGVPAPIADCLFRARAAGLAVRVEGPGDREFLAALYASTRADEIAAVPWSAEEKAAFLAMQFEAQDQHYRTHFRGAERLIVTLDDAPAGRLYAERWPAEIRVIDIALVPNMRGRGYGTALMRDVMDVAAAEESSVGIHVETANPAMRLYRRLGFEPREDKGIYQLMRWEPARRAQAKSAS
ncbi:MAG: GNAT family N-acetyltransferase [Pseudomonadota bacterium]